MFLFARTPPEPCAAYKPASASSQRNLYTDNPALLISLEGEDDLVVDVPANETYLQRVYVTAPGGTPEAQAERTDFTLRLEDTTAGDSAEKETVFNGRDN